MKKILFIFALVMMTMFAANAQTTYQVNPDSTAGTIEVYPSIEYITYDTISADTTITYVFDTDSIVSIDSVFDPHGQFLGMDTTYLCTDSLITVNYVCTEDTTFSENYIDLRAVAQDGWTFQRWVVIYATNDSVPTLDTIEIYDFDIDTETGDTVFMDGWLENIPMIDSTWDSGLQYIDITAYFVQQDTNTNSIRDITGQAEFTVYPNPTAGTIAILGDIHWITVLDMAGRVITSTDKPVIDLTNYPNGMYLIRVTDTHGNMGTRKVIKR